MSELIVRFVVGAAKALNEAISPALQAGLQRLAEIASNPELRAQISAQLEAAFEVLQAELDRYEKDPHSFLYNQMLAGPAIFLIAKQRAGDDELLFEALEGAILGGSLASEAAEAVVDAPHLSRSQRERITAGLTFLEERRWLLACDLLLKGFEGALWDTAAAHGVIDDQRYLTARQSARRQFVNSPNHLVREHGLEKLRPSFRRFVDKSVFGAEGHAVRHARGDQNERRYAYLSAAAIFGWLDRYADTRLMEELGEALDTYVESHAAIAEPQLLQ